MRRGGRIAPIGRRGRRQRDEGGLYGPLADQARREGCVGRGRPCEVCAGQGCDTCYGLGEHRCRGPIEVDHPTTRGMGGGRVDWLEQLVLAGGAECARATGCGECAGWDGELLHHPTVVPLHEGCTCRAELVRVGNCIGTCAGLHRPWLTSHRERTERIMGIDTVQLARELGAAFLAARGDAGG